MIVKKKNNIDIVIMAGGLGRRLKSFTKFLPKPLLPIKDKTLIKKSFELVNDLKAFNDPKGIYLKCLDCPLY